MRWLPCERCGDDTTFAAVVTPPVACRACGWFFAVVANGNEFRLFSGFPGRNRRWWGRTADAREGLKRARRKRRMDRL